MVLQYAVEALTAGQANILWFIFMWAALAVIAKRYHDRDKSVVWVIVRFLIPPVGIIECGFFRGTPGSNRFGHDALLDSEAENGGSSGSKRWFCLFAAAGFFPGTSSSGHRIVGRGQA